MTVPFQPRASGVGVRGSRPWWLDGLLVALLAPLPFLPTLWAGLSADDFFFATLFRESTTRVADYIVPALVQMKDVPTTFYRPVAFIALFAETKTWGGAPWPMHAVNLGLHAVSALGLWWLASLVCTGVRGTESTAFGSDPRGWHRVAIGVATLQWAWFPRRVEPVAWLSCRPDLLATALGTWGMAVWIAGERRGNAAVRAAGVLLWLVALASKESVALLPLALLLLPVTLAAGFTRSGRLGPPTLLASVALRARIRACRAPAAGRARDVGGRLRRWRAGPVHVDAAQTPRLSVRAAPRVPGPRGRRKQRDARRGASVGRARHRRLGSVVHPARATGRALRLRVGRRGDPARRVPHAVAHVDDERSSDVRPVDRVRHRPGHLAFGARAHEPPIVPAGDRGAPRADGQPVRRVEGRRRADGPHRRRGRRDRASPARRDAAAVGGGAGQLSRCIHAAQRARLCRAWATRSGQRSPRRVHQLPRGRPWPSCRSR